MLPTVLEAQRAALKPTKLLHGTTVVVKVVQRCPKVSTFALPAGGYVLWLPLPAGGYVLWIPLLVCTRYHLFGCISSVRFYRRVQKCLLSCLTTSSAIVLPVARVFCGFPCSPALATTFFGCVSSVRF